MKHQNSPLCRSFGSKTDSNASVNSMSPHRSTQCSKELGAKIPERKVSLGNATTEMCFRRVGENAKEELGYPDFTLKHSDPITHLPAELESSHEEETRTRHSRCISNESIVNSLEGGNAFAWTDEDHGLDILPMVRKVSLEPIETLSFDNQATSSLGLGSKRRRNSSLSDEMLAHENTLPQRYRDVDEELPTQPKPRKRRRLHERKQALGTQDFDAIFCKLESMNCPTDNL